MALPLMQNFESNLELNQLKSVIQNDSFQKQRFNDLKVISYEFLKENSIIKIKKILELELAANISAMVTNPFEIIETWNLEDANNIFLVVEIPKVQSKIQVEITKNNQNIFEVKSLITSTVFMMGSFVEEHVAKFWKKMIEKDLELLLKWQINQI
ncbi:MAG: hypothetical protein ACKOXS_04705 [Actinomycetes bacterium]